MKPRIGIARALHSYYHFPFFKTFLENIGIDVIISPKTNQEILQNGIRNSPAEACLPIKVFLGHISYLKDKVDYLFIPRIVCIQDTYGPGFGCPKTIGLPDLVRATYDKLPPILELNWDERISKLKNELRQIAKIFTKKGCAVNWAYNQAQQNEFNVHKLLQNGMTPDQIFDDVIQDKINQSLVESEPKESLRFNKSITIGIVGHPYLLFDSELGLDLIEQLKKQNIVIINPTMLSSDMIKCSISRFFSNHSNGFTHRKQIYWIYEQNIIGSAVHFLNHKMVDGLLLVSSFACGTCAVVNEIIQREVARDSRIPIMIILLDEHTAEAGITTRLESFVDLIKLKKINEAN